MNLELVAMPWAMFDAPSAALGVLSAHVQGNEPRVKPEVIEIGVVGHQGARAPRAVRAAWGKGEPGVMAIPWMLLAPAHGCGPPTGALQ